MRKVIIRSREALSGRAGPRRSLLTTARGPAKLLKAPDAEESGGNAANGAAQQAREKESMRLVPRLLGVFAASATLFMVASASAQAAWSDTAPTQDYHCGAYVSAPNAPPVRFQSCVLVRPSPSGAYVQGVTRVTNTSDNPNRSVRPTGYARVWLDGRVHRNDNCGSTVIAGGKTKWCYGGTTWISGKGRDVYATGYVWLGAGIHDAVNSARSNGILVYLSQACHNAAGSSTCRENVGCDGYKENAGSAAIARWAASELAKRGYSVRIGTGTLAANIRDSNALNAQIHIPIHSNAGRWDCPGANAANGGTLVMHYGGPVDHQLARLMAAEVGAKSPGTADRTEVRRDLAELRETRARSAYLEAAYHTFGPDVSFLRSPSTWAWTIAQAIDRCRGFPRNGATPTRNKECTW